MRNLDDCLVTAQGICKDFSSLQLLQAHLERSLAEVETDENGHSLPDRVSEFGLFAAHTRVRFDNLEKSFAALNGIREELVKHADALAPLQSAEGGIAALLTEARALRDRLLRGVEELESDRDEPLAARVEALSRSKRDVERRIATLAESFAELEQVRRDVGDLFVKLSADLSAHAGA